MSFLISSYWVIGEAEALQIDVPETKVREQFEKIRWQQFPQRGEFKSFLRESAQTVEDLLFRVRLNILSMEIQKHVVAGETTPSAKQHAESEFVKNFKAKWQAQTSCLPAFAVPDCGHVQPSL